MQKEIKLTEIKAKFTKDFETFGKMDPFLVMGIGKSQNKTETADGAGKQPVWKASITLSYFDEKTLIIKAYEEDMSSNQFMGEASIELASLKVSGTIEVPVFLDNGESSGIVSCKYVIKTFQPSPMLIVKNIKVELYKETKLLLKTKPYFQVSCGEHNMVTEVKEEGNSKSMIWNESLRVKIQGNDDISFNVLDKDDNGTKVFGYVSSAAEFRCQSGHKKLSVNNKRFEPLGIVEFDYETINFVSKQESKKNEQKFKEDETFMTKINLEKVRGDLLKDGVDIFFHILMGPKKVKTELIESAKKDFTQEWGLPFLAEARENKIVFALWDRNMFSNFSNSVEGYGSILLPTTSGEKKVELIDKEGKSIGSIYVTLATERIVSKTISITDIKLKTTKSADILGQSDPFIIAEIGGWSVRTETASGNECTFRRGLELRFDKETEVVFEIWDEDIDSDDKMFSETYKISNLKEKKGQITIPLKNQNGNTGQLYMKYTTKNIKHQPAPVNTPEKKKQEKMIPNREKQKKQNKLDEYKKLELSRKGDDSENQNKQKESVRNSEKSPERSPERSIGYSNLDNSKSSFKLPSIEPHNYGDRIFNKQSASTLQRSIHVYSMPKQSRFANGPKYQGEPSYYVETCFKANSGRGVGFGFGNKRQFPEWMERNMKENPAPGAYFQDHGSQTADSYRAKGPTFGISHKYYDKVTLPTEKKMVGSTQRLKPLIYKQ